MVSKQTASSLFQALIQRANDSGSFDTSLEVKALPSRELRRQHRRMADAPNNLTIGYMDELRERIQRKSTKTCAKENVVLMGKREPADTTLKVPFSCKKNVQHVERPAKAPAKPLPMSSTPVKGRATGCDLNLLTPPAGLRFIDSGNRSSNEDLQNVSTVAVDSETEDELQHGKLLKCFSLTPSARRQIGFPVKSDRPVTSAPSSPVLERKSSIFSSFRKYRSSVVSPNEESPLKRQKNVKMKNSRILNLFRSPAKPAVEEEGEGLARTCSMLSDLLANSSSSDERATAAEASLLSEENVAHFSSADREAADFSFTCEPSHSEHRDSGRSSATSAYESCRSDETIEISALAPMRLRTSTNGYPRKAISPSIRRSISNPNIIVTDANGFSLFGESIRNTAMCLTKLIKVS